MSLDYAAGARSAKIRDCGMTDQGAIGTEAHRVRVIPEQLVHRLEVVAVDRFLIAQPCLAHLLDDFWDIYFQNTFPYRDYIRLLLRA